MAENKFNVTTNSSQAPSFNNENSHFDLIMGVWLPGVICVLGIIGNLTCWLVLSRDRAKCPTFYTLRALATSDIVLLLSALLQQVIPMFCIVAKSIDPFCLVQGYIRVYAWPVICIAQLTSTWFTVLISAERYIAICRPFHASTMCNIPKVRFAVVTIVLAAVIFNIPKFFEFRPVEEPDRELNVTFISIGDTALRRHPVYRYLYNTALFCLVLYAVPLILLIYLNFRIVHNMRNARKQWRWLNRRTKTEMKATVLPLVIVCVVFVCSTQSLVAFILDAVYLHYSVWLQKYTAFVNILVILNSAINFILMYLFGKKFRVMMLRMFCCTRHKKGSPILTSKVCSQSEPHNNYSSSTV